MEFLHVTGMHAGVACFRKWEPVPSGALRPAPEVITVANSRTFSINFNTRKEEYVTCWFRAPETRKREELRLEVGPFGVPALYVRPDGDGAWLANFRLPPGLTSGWHDVRLRFADSDWAASTVRIAVDMPLRVEALVLKGVCDGATWNETEVHEYLSAWVVGLPENCDRSNVSVWLGDLRLAVTFVGPLTDGVRQVNASLPTGTAKREYACRVECAGVSTDTRMLRAV